MAKVTNKSGLNVGTELIIDEPARTYQLVEAGNITAKDGVSWQALYSKLVDLWATATYQDSPFPMNAIDVLSGQYEVGVDAGGNYNGWAPADQTTRDILRDGGADEYDASGNLLRTYCGIIGLGAVSTGSQLYYITEIGGTPTNFVYTDQANQMVQVFGNAANGNFDTQTYFKAFCREEGYKYSDSILEDTGKTGTGAYIVNVLLSNELDTKITDPDTEMASAPYSGITVEYFGVAQSRTVGGASYNFDVIVEGNGATLEEIYTKVQYLLRQNANIDSGAGTVIGKTAAILMNFVGDTLETTTGVYIDNIDPADANRVKFKDTGGTFRVNDYLAAGTLNFNSLLVGAGSSYRLMFTTGPGAGDDYGEAGAITVQDSNGVDITGTISSGTISFDFDYNNDTLGGTAATDKPVTLVAIRPGFGKFAVGTGILSQSKAISISVVAEADRAYA